jgi:hypothetical protein
MSENYNQDGIPAIGTSPDTGAETAKSSKLELLGDAVARNVSIVSDYLQKNNLPQPSFERNASLTFIPPKSPSHIQQAHQALMEAALKLFQLASGPIEYIPNLALGVRSPNPCINRYSDFSLSTKLTNTTVSLLSLPSVVSSFQNLQNSPS